MYVLERERGRWVVVDGGGDRGNPRKEDPREKIMLY